MRRLLLAAAMTAGLYASWVHYAVVAIAQEQTSVQWIWSNEGDPTRQAPAGTRYFRKTFDLKKTVDEGVLDITADGRFTVWLNGVRVGEGSDWKHVRGFDVTRHFVMGQNVVAVEVQNVEGPAGLLVRLGYVPNGQSRAVVASDATWRTSKQPPEGWQKVGFDDGGWAAVKVLGPYGHTGRWTGLVWDSGGDDRFAVPEGFVVEMAAKNPDPNDPFSLINLTFDDHGRLLVSQENGPVLLCTEPDQAGVCQSVKPYCSQVKTCQGMCWVDDALLVVGDGPDGPGLYRARDTKGSGHTDQVTLVHKFEGPMGEHGPHAIVHGPDNWLYLITGNHAWAHPDRLAANSPLARWPRGQMGPDQGQPGTTEDVLLPRLNDANGHAANKLAPGGTIWRLDRDGKNMALVAAGFRNAYDMAFSPQAELFTFDSDMEWDLELPWYRAVRICHCPPGADFLWRTGSANTPNYYIDSLPPIYETGRGSPVGLEFYDHPSFPERYRGTYFMADWSLGLVYAVALTPDGASYRARPERFCLGNPMNITDIVVGPDGALYFTMGGRHSQGGVYRIRYRSLAAAPAKDGDWLEAALHQPQPLAAWGRAQIRERLKPMLPDKRKEVVKELSRVARDARRLTRERVRALDVLQNHVAPPGPKLLVALAGDDESAVRAHAVWLLGVNGYADGRDALLKALRDTPAIRRRACEALIRAGIEPSVEAIWPLLGDSDRFVRTAARLVLQRTDPKLWTERLWSEPNEQTALQGIIALCKTGHAKPYASGIFERLAKWPGSTDVPALLDYLRTVQVALVHAGEPVAPIPAIARRCRQEFPHADSRVNRELAILLAHFGVSGDLDDTVHSTLLLALLGEPDRQQQIYYYYCLRLLHHGWTHDEKRALLAWYETAKTWQGGHSFSGYLDNILRDVFPIFTAHDLTAFVAKGDQLPAATQLLLRQAGPELLPTPNVLFGLYKRLRAHKVPPARFKDLRDAIVDALGKSPAPDTQQVLRKIADREPEQRDRVARALAHFPSTSNWPYLLRGLDSSNPLVLFDVIEALKHVPSQPRTDDPGPYRAVLVASARLDEKNRWKAVELLRHWSNDRQFSGEEGDWKAELTAWARWFSQTFPREPALPDVVLDRPPESKYKFGELLDFLDKDAAGRHGDVERGRLVFDKAQCIKCHKYGRIGEGVGPDLTTVSKRFKRTDILESILYPSKVISDQYRSTTIVTTRGLRIDGLAAPQGDTVTVLQSDGTRVTLKKDDIEQQFASLVSVMPERLLDTLSRQEIADLFAFLESEPK
jgi:putative heme-binding domain-containing protein